MTKVAVVLGAVAVFLLVGVAAAFAADEYAGPKTWVNGDSAQGSYSQTWDEDDFAKGGSGYSTYSGFKRGTDYGLQGVTNSNTITQYHWVAPTTSKAGYCKWLSTVSNSGGCIEEVS